MRKFGMTALLAAVLLVAQGCGFLNSALQTVDFASETTAYMQELTRFGQEMGGLAEQAVTDAAARAELQERLTALKEQALNYENLKVPDYAADLHRSIVEYNETLQGQLDQAIANLEQGKAAFAETGIPDTINKLNELLSQLNGLAP